jgi:hypothetical protein
MIWLVLVPLVILWAFVGRHIAETTGSFPRSRGSMRNQRRKATKLGLNPESVAYNPRLTPYEPLKIPRWITWSCGAFTLLFWAAVILWR